MKCPFCGFDSKTQHCEHCRAMIPVAKEEPKEEEPVSIRRKRKEMKEHGT